MRERISALYIRYHLLIYVNTILYYCVGPQIRKVDGQTHRGTIEGVRSNAYLGEEALGFFA